MAHLHSPDGRLLVAYADLRELHGPNDRAGRALAAHERRDRAPGAPPLRPAELARAATDPLELEDAIAALYRYSLIGRDQTGLRVHRLVQAVVASSLLTEERSLWIERAVGLLLVA
ncbi:MAG: hypothetical protein ACRDJK_14770, partial [Actinomycetota bacterium]